MSGRPSMFLGVDGGGTKTALCLVDGDGRVRASTQAPSIYYFAEGLALVERVLRQGVDAVCEQAGLTTHDIDHAFVGLPGYGESSREVAALDAVPRAVLGHDRYTVGNDMVCGWAGSLGAQDGINVVSGTGSIAYGEHAGRRSRVGGWSELFGDEGSGYWIAVRGLAAFSRMSDGRLPAGPLLDVLRAHLELTGDLDLIDVVVNQWQGGRTRIAALSPLVVDAADRGDACAAGILDDAARELADLVDATRRRLEFEPGDTVPVSYSGGVFSADTVRDAFAAELAARDGGYDLRRPVYSPVVGAALYAARLAGTPLGDQALHRLRSTTNGGLPVDDDVAER